jgi:prefoldin subunit 5
MDVGDLQNLRTKIDELMARIDDLENRAAGANPQLEVLTFVMTGLFLMFIVDLAVRKSSGVRMVSVR